MRFVFNLGGIMLLVTYIVPHFKVHVRFLYVHTVLLAARWSSGLAVKTLDVAHVLV